MHLDWCQPQLVNGVMVKTEFGPLRDEVMHQLHALTNQQDLFPSGIILRAIEAKCWMKWQVHKQTSTHARDGKRRNAGHWPNIDRQFSFKAYLLLLNEICPLQDIILHLNQDIFILIKVTRLYYMNHWTELYEILFKKKMYLCKSITLGVNLIQDGRHKNGYNSVSL